MNKVSHLQAPRVCGQSTPAIGTGRTACNNFISCYLVELETDVENQTASVTQLGFHPTRIDDVELTQGSTALMTQDSVLYIVGDLFPYKVEFCADAAESGPALKRGGDPSSSSIDSAAAGQRRTKRVRLGTGHHEKTTDGDNEASDSSDSEVERKLIAMRQQLGRTKGHRLCRRRRLTGALQAKACLLQIP